MLKKVVLFTSGIINKKVVHNERISDFETYFLLEDISGFKKSYTQEEQERYKKHLNLFVELDDHLFPICSQGQGVKLWDYTSDSLLSMQRKSFNNAVLTGGRISRGVAQYLGREEEYYKALEREKQKRDNDSIERKRIMEEEERQRQMEHNKELKQASLVFLKGGDITGDNFLSLCDKLEVKLPIRTRGWVIKNLDIVSKNSYSANTRSTVIFDYVRKLEEALLESMKTPHQ